MYEIIKNNNLTFYDQVSGKKLSVRLRFLLEILVSLFISFIFTSNNSTFLSAVLTALSILAGFGFNTLIFLMARKREKPEDCSPSEDNNLESILSVKKDNDLYKEIFHNISYFNFICIVCMVFSMVLLFSGSFVWSAYFIQKLGHDNIVIAFIIYTYILKFMFWLSCIECLYSLLRILFRLNFMFSRIIART